MLPSAGAARRRTSPLDGGAEQAGCGQEHAAPVGLDRLAEAALGPRVEPETGEVGDEDVRFQAPQVRLPQAVRQSDDVREHCRAVQSQALPGCVSGQLEGERDLIASRERPCPSGDQHPVDG
jgi:hypothetical protein